MQTFTRYLFATSLVLAPITASPSAVLAQESLERDEALAGLPDVFDLNGAAFDLAETIASNELTVLVWFATECPCVVRYQQRIESLHETYAEVGLQVLLVDSNADDSVAEIQGALEFRNFDVPLIHDPDAQLASLFSVRSTPTVVVLDSSGSTVFSGWIDNEREPGQRGRDAWLENTVVAWLGGTLSGAVDTPTYGCTITRRRAR